MAASLFGRSLAARVESKWKKDVCALVRVPCVSYRLVAGRQGPAPDGEG
jgi:hypothetical protein